LSSATPVCWASDSSTNRSSAGGSAAAATTRKPACPAELDPIAHRDRVESLSPLPRHVAVAIP